MKRNIRKVHAAAYAPISDLVTYRALPTAALPMNALDPFLFLNHHGHQVYPAGNGGLPFGPHPHRGFETVTFILEGDLMHQDSSGASSIITAGGVQWMTAGSGLVHAELSSDAFKEKGGPLEILQLWVNLPARLKMTPPKYTGLQRADIPVLKLAHDQVSLHAVSGTWWGCKGPVEPLTDTELCWMTWNGGAALELSIPPERTVLFYVVRGTFLVNGTTLMAHQLAEFGHEGDGLHIEAPEDGLLLLGHAAPFREPIVAYGPFVMNTEEEIRQAYADWEQGRFGNGDLG
ncbi:pirin family protein [Flaviaesturariibacter amylovorans]